MRRYGAHRYMIWEVRGKNRNLLFVTSDSAKALRFANENRNRNGPFNSVEITDQDGTIVLDIQLVRRKELGDD